MHTKKTRKHVYETTGLEKSQQAGRVKSRLSGGNSAHTIIYHHHFTSWLFSSLKMATAVAESYLALLREPDDGLKAYALQLLDKNVEQLWAQVADHVSEMYESQ